MYANTEDKDRKLKANTADETEYRWRTISRRQNTDGGRLADDRMQIVDD